MVKGTAKSCGSEFTRLLVVFFMLASCKPHQSSQNTMPTFVLESATSVEGPYGGGLRVEAPDVPVFAQQFHDAGWISGLQDKRSISDASDRSISAVRSSDSQGQKSPWRVCDLFLFYYEKQKSGVRHIDYGRIEDRDAAIDRALVELKTTEAKTGARPVASTALQSNR